MKRIKFRLKNKNKKCSTSYINIEKYRSLQRLLFRSRQERKICIWYKTGNKSRFFNSQVIFYNRYIKKIKNILKGK